MVVAAVEEVNMADRAVEEEEVAEEVRKSNSCHHL